jgi:HEPN domain-containing protein
MADSKDVNDWVRFAEDDFQGALEMLSAHPRIASRLFGEACEKYLKAVMLARGVEPPQTHNLRRLLAELDPTFANDSLEVAAASLLTGAAPAGRYPGEWGEPSAEQAQALHRAAEVLRSKARAWLGLT